MEKLIKVVVRNKIAICVSESIYICNNSDYFIEFDFDEEWSEYNYKTVRFIFNDTYIDVVLDNDNRCAVPIISDTYEIEVGVFAGNLRTTTPALIHAQKSILCESGYPTEPPADVYAQIMEELNALNADIGTAVGEWLKDNPIEGTTFETDDTLILKDGILSVNTTNDVEQDNTLPITSSAVFTTVGNISAILDAI